MNTNYPDDVRQYDWDERSPFYTIPAATCKDCRHRQQACKSTAIDTDSICDYFESNYED